MDNTQSKKKVLAAFRLEQDLMDQIKARAVKEDRSMNSIVSAVLKDLVNYDNYSGRVRT